MSRELPSSPPARPGVLQERLTTRLLLALAPRLRRPYQPEPQPHFQPFEHLRVPRWGRGGELAAIWFPATGSRPGQPARGAVLLLHPWIDGGKSFFLRRGRIEALRRAGYHVLACDLSGLAAGPSPDGYFDRDVDDALDELHRRGRGLPLHLWGVSSGGYWAHTVLSRREGISGAMFEDVFPHVLEWSRRTAPWGIPFYTFFRTIAPGAYRFLDLRNHAPCLRTRATAYVSGGEDRGVALEATRELAAASGGEALVVPGAGHLAAIRLAQDEILELALKTFRRAEGAEISAAS